MPAENIRDHAEIQVPRWGIATLRDPETGLQRCLFMRPRLKQAFQDAFARRRRTLVEIFRMSGRDPFFVIGGFQADAMTRYFFH